MMKEIMVNIIEYLGKKPRVFLIVLGFVLVAFVGVIRYLTGPEFAFSLFFLLPIFLGTWFAGRWAGILLAITSALTWLTSDLVLNPPYLHPVIPYVNETLRLSVFLIMMLSFYQH